MHRKLRAIRLVGILLVVITLFSIYSFNQFKVPNTWNFVRGSLRHLAQKPETQNKQELPSSPNPHCQHLPAGNLSNERGMTKMMKQPERNASISKKGWDEQDVVGKGHPWQQFHRDIHQDALYSEGASYMTDLLHDLATVKITNASQFTGGSQLKLYITLADGNRVMAKPMRVPRDFVYNYSRQEPFWLDPERHNAEIASFHLDRLLGFRRVPPCTGRLVNFKKEILRKTRDGNLLTTIFKNDGNLCVIGKCSKKFCDANHPICTKGDVLELSMCQFLPAFEGGNPFKDARYPWDQNYNGIIGKRWMSRNVCLDYLKSHTWRKGRLLLDLIDQGIMDFLMLNYDRHHYSHLRKYKGRGCTLNLDNGKGFGNPLADDVTLLAPVYQCCKVRRSTYLRLKELARPESRLSDRLRSSMSNDPITPVVTEDYLQALDRRLATALQTIDKCIQDNGESQVVVERLDN